MILGDIFLSNTSSSDDVSLEGASILSTADALFLTIRLTEAQRVAAHFFSNTTGGGGSGESGDGGPIFLNILHGAIRDTALNPANTSRELPVLETPDVHAPIFTNASLDYGLGILRIQANETIDVTPPKSQVNLRRVFISNVSTDHALSLLGASVTKVDATVVTVTLTELQRSLAIAFSGTSGGDGASVFIDILAGAFRDVGNNSCADFEGLVTEETDDTIPPTVLSADLNYSTGFLVATFSETIDTTPASSTTTENFVIVELVDAGLNTVNIVLDSSTVVESDKVTVTLILSESERTAALVQSSVPGATGRQMRSFCAPFQAPSSI